MPCSIWFYAEKISSGSFLRSLTRLPAVTCLGFSPLKKVVPDGAECTRFRTGSFCKISHFSELRKETVSSVLVEA